MANKASYHSVSHILASDSKPELRSFCDKMFNHLDTDHDHRDLVVLESVSAMENFDVFFGKVSISVSSFKRFMDCLIVKPKGELDDTEHKVELFVEHMVWNFKVFNDLVLKSPAEDSIIENRNVLFKLFCLFNRFSSGNCLTIDAKNANFILKKLKLSVADLEDSLLDFYDFQHLVLTSGSFVANRDAKSPYCLLDGLYKLYVKDILKEDLVKCKVIPILNGKSISNRKSSFYNSEQSNLLGHIFFPLLFDSKFAHSKTESIQLLTIPEWCITCRSVQV